MDWLSAQHWPRIAGGIAAALLGLALLSFDLDDPSLTNLRAHSQGIQNWLGLPGALFGGSLVEVLGSSALALPLLLLNYTLSHRNRPRLLVYLGWSLALACALSALHGLWVEPLRPGLGDPGLMGWSLRHWAALTTGPVAATLITGVVILAAMNRVAFHPVARQALADARLFLGWSGREGTATVRGLGSMLKGGTLRGGSLLGELGAGAVAGVVAAAALLTALLLAPFRAVAGAVSAMRMPSVGKVKARLGPGTSNTGAASPAAGLAQPGEVPELDPFDLWMAQSMDESPEGAATPTHAPAETPPPTGEGPSPLSKLAAMLGGRDEDASDVPEPDFELDRSSFAGHLADATPPVTSDAEADRAPEEGTTGSDPATRETTGQDEDSSEVTGEDPVAAAVHESLDYVDQAYDFDQPEAEVAWRERFQRYARNLDLDWDDQIWGESQEEETDGPHTEGSGEPRKE